MKELEREGGHYFDEIVEIIERLRAPGGCPWDRKQTMESLRSCITEEAYELADAITRRDMAGVKEEAGDLLLQVVFIASLAREAGAFDMRDVVRGICDKLIRRHPHVFGDGEVPEDLRGVWERRKRQEKGRTSSLDGIARSMSSLARTQKVIARARSHEVPVGFPSEPVTAEDAETAATLWQDHPTLSLGDRLCLALGHRLAVPVLTADRAWGNQPPIIQIR